MDFHALPRRDLQALCKRNGVRANMTNAAMADALGALSTVDGIEEYVKQPAAVPAPADKAAVAEEEVRREKQGSPLPRGRRVTVKPAESIKTNESKEVGKADAKQELNKEEDAPALGVGRRGPGRRAPVVAKPAAPPLAAAEEKQASPPPRARRVNLKSSAATNQNGRDEEEKVDAKPESNKEEDAPAIGVGRRGASRRARPAPAVATAAAEPAVKIAAVEGKHGSPPPRARRVTAKLSQPASPKGGEEDETEGLKREANNEDAPAHGEVRRGASRRARSALVVSKLAAKAVVELGSPQPRGRRRTVSVKPSAPACTDGGVEGENEDVPREASKGKAKPESNQEDAPAIAVGRRGASRRARPEPAASAAEEDAPVQRGRRVKVKKPEPIRLKDGDEEGKEVPTLEEEEEEDGAGRQGLSRRARPTPTRRAVASTTEEGNVAVEAIPVRPARQRRLTMKAAAGEEIVLRRATKRTALQQEKNQQESQVVSDAEVVHASVFDEMCNNPENVAMTADPHNEEVVDEPKQEDGELVMNGRCADPNNVEDAAGPQIKEQNWAIDNLKQKDEVSELVMNGWCVEAENVKDAAGLQIKEQNEAIDEQKQDNEGDKPEITPDSGVISDAEVVHAPGSDEGCDDPDNVEETADLQNEEQMEVIDEPKEEDEELLMNGRSVDSENGEVAVGPQIKEQNGAIDELKQEDEEFVMNDHEILTEEDLKEEALVTDQECADESPLEEHQVDLKHFADSLPRQEDEEFVMNDHEMEEDIEEEALVTDQECADESPVEKHQVDPEHFADSLSRQEDEELVMNESCANPENVEEATGPQNKEKNVLIDKPKQDNEGDSLVAHGVPFYNEELALNEDEILIEENLGEVALVPDQECAEKTPPEEHQVDTKHCADSLPSQDDSPILGLVLMAAGQTIEEGGSCTFEGLLEIHHAGENVELAPVIQALQASHAADDFVEKSCFAVNAGHGNERENSHEVLVAVDDGIVQETADKELSEPKDETVETTVSQQAKDEAFIDEDDFHVGELKEADIDKVELVGGELPLCTDTMDEDTDEDQTAFIHAGEKKETATADNVPEVVMTNGKVIKQERVLITEEMQQLTGATDEEDVANDQLEDAFTADLRRKLDIATDSSDHISSALLDITETISKITISEPSVSEDVDILMCKNSEKDTAELVCKNSSEKNTGAEPVCMNSNENTSAEPVCMNSSEKNITESVATKEKKGMKVAKKSKDYSNLSLRRLRATVKETLQRNSEKRVALARVDENVCRSKATGQEQVRNLQQY